MLNHAVAWGLDIGHSSIKAAKLARQGEKAVVQGYAIEPIKVAEGGDRDGAIINALQQLAIREEFGSTPVMLALSGRQVYSKTVNIPVLNQKKMVQMVELEARQQIPGNFDEVEWGYYASPAVDGASVDCTLFAVKRDIIQELIDKSKKAGVNLVGVSVSNLALYNFIQFDQVFPADEAVVILDVGAENTDLVIYQGDMLWMNSISVSGNDITKAFVKKFRVSEEEAETLKRQASDSRQADKIIKVIEGTLSELTTEVNRRIGFYRSQNKDAKFENLIISGNTFRLAGLPEYMAEKLRFTINILEDLDRIQVDSGFEREHFMQDLQSLGVAMGLGLQAVGFAKAQVNLMPSQMQLERVLKSKRYAAVIAVLLIGATAWIDYSVVSTELEQNSELNRTSKKAFETNTLKMQGALQLLESVAPEAQRLKQFDDYGIQVGVTQAVIGGAVSVVETVVKDFGKPEPGPGGEAGNQAVWLNRVELPPASAATAGPFQPFSAPRSVTVVVHIPRAAKQKKEIRKAIEDRLKALPVPEYLQVVHKGSRLFSDVQVGSEMQVADTYHFIDGLHLDEKGDRAPIDETREVAVNAQTFTCTLTGAKEATP